MYLWCRCGIHVGKEIWLRAFAENFDEDNLKNAIEYAHGLGKKVYVTVNIFATNNDIVILEIILNICSQ